MRITQVALALTLLAGPALAQASDAADRALLAALSPQMRAEVESRMRGGGQRVHEIADTILLNKISLAFATRRIVATDYAKGVAVVEAADGSLRAVRFDVLTLELRPG